MRAAALAREKAALDSHLDLLEEHLARLKEDLQLKQSEVQEVEHQWKAAKAKLPALREKKAHAEEERDFLRQLVAKLKAYLVSDKKGGGSNGAAPKALLQALDPMELKEFEDAPVGR